MHFARGLARSMDNDDLLPVEVVFAESREQRLIALGMAPGSTVIEAIRAAGLEIPMDSLSERVGVFGRRCCLSDVLAAGDRVEIYRPLRHDPKAIRRRRASRARDYGPD